MEYKMYNMKGTKTTLNQNSDRYSCAITHCHWDPGPVSDRCSTRSILSPADAINGTVRQQSKS